MRDHTVHTRLLAAATATAVIAALPASAATRDGRTGITVTKVAVEAGRLIIEGTTPKAGQVVGLVTPKAAVRSARSGKSIRRFSISVPSTPANCRAVLTLGVKVSAPMLISGCAVAGPAGPAGPNGRDGATGPTGPEGEFGAAGSAGPTGPSGPTGAAGATGATGPAGVVSVAAVPTAPGASVTITNSPAGLNFPFVFVTAPLTALATPGQTIAASQQVTVTTGNVGVLSYAICFKPPGAAAGSTPFPYQGQAQLNAVPYAAGQIQTISASGAWVADQQGAYAVGICVASAGVGSGLSGEQSVMTTGHSNGFVMITAAP